MSHAKVFSSSSFIGQSSPPHIAGEHPNILKHILRAGINLSLWERPADPEITKELTAIKASDLPDMRSETSPSTFDNDICTLLQQQNLDPRDFQYWRRDLRHLAEIYFPISNGRQVTMRLESSDEARCPRFHVDRTHLRLLCTYRGQSTEWLTEQQTNREAQSDGAPNEDIVRFGQASSFGTFNVGVMKGNSYPDNSGLGLVHRSPPVNGVDRTRVLFCLDC